MTSSKRAISQVQNDLSSSSSSDEELDNFLSSLARKSSDFKLKESKNQYGSSSKKRYTFSSNNLISSSKISVSGNTSSTTESKDDQSSSILSLAPCSDSVSDDISIPEVCPTRTNSNQMLQNYKDKGEKENNGDNQINFENNASNIDVIDFGKYSKINKEFELFDQFLDYSLLNTITEEKKINEREKQRNFEVVRYEANLKKIDFLSGKKCLRILNADTIISEKPKDAENAPIQAETTGYNADELKFMDLKMFNMNLADLSPESQERFTMEIKNLVTYMRAVVSTRNLKTVESISNLVLEKFNPTFYNSSAEIIQHDIDVQLKNLDLRQSILEKIDDEDFKIENHLVPLLEKVSNNDGDTAEEKISATSDEDEIFKQREIENTKATEKTQNLRPLKFKNSTIYLVLKKLKFFSQIVIQCYLSSSTENIGSTKKFLLRFIKLHFVLLNEERVNFYGKRCITEVSSILTTLISGYLSKNQISLNTKNEEIFELVLVVVNLTRSPLILFTLYSNFTIFKPNHGPLFPEGVVNVFQTFFQIIIFSEDMKLESIIDSLMEYDFMKSRLMFSTVFKNIIIDIIFKQLSYMSNHALKVEKCSFENDMDAEQIRSLLPQIISNSTIKSPYLERLIQISENFCGTISIYSNLEDDFERIISKKTNTDSLIAKFYDFYSSMKKFGTSPYWLLLKFNCLKSLMMSSLINAQTLKLLSQINEQESGLINLSEKNSLKFNGFTDLIGSIASMIMRITDNYIPLHEIPKDLNTAIVFLEAQKKLGFIKNMIDDVKREFCLDIGKIDY